MRRLTTALLPLIVGYASIGGCLSTPTVTTGAEGGTSSDGHSASTSKDSGDTSDGGAGHTGDTGAGHADGAILPDSGGVRDGGADVTLPPIDASLPFDAATDGSATSRCSMSATAIVCSNQLYTITTPAGSDTEAGTTYPSYSRAVYYQVPLGTAPTAGWPTVFIFQGSFISAQYTFAATSDEEYGLYYQTEVVMNLLDAGYAVLAPESLDSGDTYWQTNIAPYAASWSGAPDDLLVQAMITDVGAGTFGPLDVSRLYATGISSGGYMTSRMAVSYPGKFKALAIESGSYATCLSGESAVTDGLCTVPTLSATHPPTLLMHGTEDTTIVPEWTVTAYVTALTTASVPEKEIDDATSGHQWIPEAPAAVLAWFNQYP